MNLNLTRGLVLLTEMKTSSKQYIKRYVDFKAVFVCLTIQKLKPESPLFVSPLESELRQLLFNTFKFFIKPTHKLLNFF